MNGDIGIRELKAHLSDVVARVAAGERIRITDRGKPKALLVPLPGVDRIAVGRAEGWITPGAAAGTPMPRPATRFRPRPGMSTESIHAEDRDE